MTLNHVTRRDAELLDFRARGDTWATRKYVPFVMQRISIAVQIAAASEIRQALGRGMGPDSA